MVNLFKVIAHIREVGWTQFREEFGERKEEIAQDPLSALNLQRTGYLGSMLFSIVAGGIFFYKGMWYIGGIFVFNLLIQSGQLLSIRNQIKMFKDISNA